MFKLFLIYGAFSILLSIPINIYTAKSSWDLFEKMIFKSEALTGLKSWSHVVLVVFFTIATLYTISGMKREAS